MPAPDASFRYELHDVTLVIGVRLGDGNPWALERLARLRGYYRSLPPVLVVDQGSSARHASLVEAVCRESGFAYFWEADEEPYCPARAKNLGASRATTPLLFFSDVDFLGEPGLFERVVDAVNLLQFDLYLDQILTLPIYHLTKAATKLVLEAERPSDVLGQVLARSVYSAAGEDVEFVAPYSNCFLCRRDFYDLVGGQNERFRRHGSEDFEFLLRVAVFTGQYPLPEHPEENCLGPTQAAYYGAKPYRGFRRLFELMALQTELLGLRIVHLDHERPRPGEAWFRDHEDKRAAFERETAPYLKNPKALVGYDFMPRTKTIRVAPLDAAQADLLTLLRLEGYRLQPEGVGLSGPEPMAEVSHVAMIGETDAADQNQGSPPSSSSDGLARVTFTAGKERGSFALYDPSQGAREGRIVLGTVSPLPGLPRVPRYVAHEFCGRSWKRVALERTFSSTSYASARLALGDSFKRKQDIHKRLASFKGRFRKLLTSPRLFLQDSRFPQVRALERLTRRRP